MYSAQGKRIGRPPRDEGVVAEMTLREEAAREVVPPPPETIPEKPVWQRKSPTRKFTADMIDPWLRERLEIKWPGHSDAWWHGKFRFWEQSNEFLCIYNDRAVLLAERKNHPITNRPEAEVIFCWSRDAEGSWLVRDKSTPVMPLYWEMRRWISDQGGERFWCGLCDDLRGDTIARLMIEQGPATGMVGVVVEIERKR